MPADRKVTKPINPTQRIHLRMAGILEKSFDLAQLRHAVTKGLCVIGDFEPGAFQITERLLMRAGEACGIHFCLHGPRNVKISAVADLQRRQVLYYGTDGQRVEQQQIPAFCCINQ